MKGDGTDKYWLWINGVQTGPLNLYRIRKMAKESAEIAALNKVAEEKLDDESNDEEVEIIEDSAAVTRETPFWSETLNEWRPLWDLPNDWMRVLGGDPLAGFVAAGIERVAFLATHTDADCPHCQLMDGTVFRISEAPSLPFPKCTCSPYSGGVWLARE